LTMRVVSLTTVADIAAAMQNLNNCHTRHWKHIWRIYTNITYLLNEGHYALIDCYSHQCRCLLCSSVYRRKVIDVSLSCSRYGCSLWSIGFLFPKNSMLSLKDIYCDGDSKFNGCK
ncbi:Hypothetical predicted protein, partial [Mytilus galloprovincialis]